MARGRPAPQALLSTLGGRHGRRWHDCSSSGPTSTPRSAASTQRIRHDPDRSLPERRPRPPPAGGTGRHHQRALGQPSLAIRGRGSRPRPTARGGRGGGDPQGIRAPDGRRGALPRGRTHGHVRAATDRPGALLDLHEGAGHQRGRHRAHRPDRAGGGRHDLVRICRHPRAARDPVHDRDRRSSCGSIDAGCATPMAGIHGR